MMSIIFKAIFFIHLWHRSLEKASPYNSAELTPNFHTHTDYLVLEKSFPIPGRGKEIGLDGIRPLLAQTVYDFIKCHRLTRAHTHTHTHTKKATKKKPTQLKLVQ